MSTTDQLEKTKEETATRRKRTEAKVEPEKKPLTRRTNVEKVSENTVESNQSATSQTSSSSEKEKRRKRSASAEVEMTETLKQTRKEQKKQQKAEKRKNKKPRLRIFPVWLRLVLVVGLSIAALCVGLMVGYGVLGDGNPKDALQWETWQHIIDLIYKEE